MQINSQFLNSTSNIGFGGNHPKAIVDAAKVAIPALGTILANGSAGAATTTVATTVATAGAAIGTVAVAAAPFALTGAAIYGLYKLVSDN